MVEPVEPTTQEEKMKEFKGKLDKKETKDIETVIKQVATRDKLERDYFEDLLEVQFTTAPGIKRMVKARRPTQKQMLLIMTLSLQASIYEKLNNEQAIKKITDIYEQLSTLAAELCEDKKLNVDFWSSKVSFTTLQNFISELIRITQQGPIGEKDLDSFR